MRVDASKCVFSFFDTWWNSYIIYSVLRIQKWHKKVNKFYSKNLLGGSKVNIQILDSIQDLNCRLGNQTTDLLTFLILQSFVKYFFFQKCAQFGSALFIILVKDIKKNKIPSQTWKLNLEWTLIHTQQYYSSSINNDSNNNLLVMLSVSSRLLVMLNKNKFWQDWELLNWAKFHSMHM